MTTVIQSRFARLQFIDVAEMRAFEGDTLANGDSVNLIGGALPGDGAGDDFHWNSTSTASEDAPLSVGTVVKRTDEATGRFIRSDQSRITANMFGAGDGFADTVNDTAIAAASAFLVAKGGGTLYFDEGTYDTNGLNIKDRVNWIGEGIDSTIINYTGAANGTVVGAESTRIFYCGIENMTIDANASADFALDLAFVSFSSFRNLLLLSPLDAAIFLDGSRNGVNFDSGCVLNHFDTVKHFSIVGDGTNYGARMIDAANSNVFTNFISSNADIGWAVEDEVNVTGAFSNHNVLADGAIEPFATTAVFLNGESNIVAYPRMESGTNGILFGTSSKQRFNRVIGPAFFSVTNKLVNLRTADNNNVEDVNDSGRTRFFSSLNLEPSAGNATFRAVPNNGATGTHDGAANASVLTDTTASFVPGNFVGRIISNTTDGSTGVITANTATTVTATLSGGTDDDWDVSDAYSIASGFLVLQGGTTVASINLEADDDEFRVRSIVSGVSGTHDGAANASVLTDTTASFVANRHVGSTITNTTDGSSGVVTANTATTITASLSGGTDDDWDVGDAYSISTTFNDGIEMGVANSPTPRFPFGSIVASVTTANRPTTINGVPLGNFSTHRGLNVFDETLGHPIWWKGAVWVDGVGTTV